MLKRALRQRPLRRVALAGDSLGTHYDHFARLHIVQVHRSDQIERAGFGCEDVSGVAVQFHLPHGQRAEAVRIARHDDAVLGQEHQRESALDLQQRIAQSASQRALGGVRHQVQDHLGIAIGLEDGAAPLQLRAQLNGVGDVAVVRHRHLAFIAGHREGLRIQQRRVARGGVARVADGQLAGQFGKRLGGEDFRHVPHGFPAVDFGAVARADARAFLAAMLQCVQAQVGHLGGLGMAVNGDYAALVMEFIKHVL